MLAIAHSPHGILIHSDLELATNNNINLQMEAQPEFSHVLTKPEHKSVLRSRHSNVE